MRELLTKGLTGLLALVLTATAAQARPFRDPLDTPAAPTQQVTRSPLLAINAAGSRLVAVGLRGLIVYSDDQGRNWRQANNPVSTDLVAVQFVTPREGWACGHDGVVLHSTDGGENWSKQLDGRSLQRLLVPFYEQRQQGGETAVEAALQQARDIGRDGLALPLLGIWFVNARQGYAVGSFGLILRTEDGGANWEPMLHAIDNPGALNLNAIRGAGAEIYIAAERGTVFKLDSATGRFLARKAPYSGSFFDIVGDGSTLLAFGLRGRAYRSSDGGTTWQEAQTGLDTSITGGTMTADGATILVSQGGRVVASTDGGLSFTPLAVPNPGLFTGVHGIGEKGLVVIGFGGVSLLQLDARKP